MVRSAGPAGAASMAALMTASRVLTARIVLATSRGTSPRLSVRPHGPASTFGLTTTATL
jgi:hypothetical protein